MFDVLKPY